MNPHAQKLLRMPACDVIGTKIKFRSMKSKRTRFGTITSFGASSVRVVTLDGRSEIVSWPEILES